MAKKISAREAAYQARLAKAKRIFEQQPNHQEIARFALEVSCAIQKALKGYAYAQWSYPELRQHLAENCKHQHVRKVMSR